MNQTKWLKEIILWRHPESAYNELMGIKMRNELYLCFLDSYNNNFQDKETRRLAMQVKDKLALGVGDFGTPLSSNGISQAMATASELEKHFTLPDVIIVSPYIRTQVLYKIFKKHWKKLSDVPIYYDERIIEKKHGLALLYNDHRVFYALHPEQKELMKIMGSYWYQYPQGEDTPMVRRRAHQFIEMLIREYSGKCVSNAFG